LGKVRDGFKEHAKSFHPLLCFIGETRDFLWGKFRPGNRYASQGAVEFLKECLKRLSCGMKAIFLRADSAFFDNQFLSEVERRGIWYSGEAL
jgi:hypothetical protein